MDTARHRAAGWWRSWRQRPRARWTAWSRGHAFVAIMTGAAWLASLQGGWAVLTGGADPSGGRGRAAAAYTLVALAAAAPLTWLCWVYVRRPVEPREDPYLSPAGEEERRLRDEAERLRWSPMAPHGDV